MNGVRVLTVVSHASEDRVQRSFLSDRSLLKRLLPTQVNNSLLFICNRHSVSTLCVSVIHIVCQCVTPILTYREASSDYTALVI